VVGAFGEGGLAGALRVEAAGAATRLALRGAHLVRVRGRVRVRASVRARVRGGARVRARLKARVGLTALLDGALTSTR